MRQSELFDPERLRERWERSAPVTPEEEAPAGEVGPKPGLAAFERLRTALKNELGNFAAPLEPLLEMAREELVKQVGDEENPPLAGDELEASREQLGRILDDVEDLLEALRLGARARAAEGEEEAEGAEVEGVESKLEALGSFTEGLEGIEELEAPDLAAIGEELAVGDLSEVGAEAVGELPGASVLEEIPGADALSELPGADALGEIPGADAVGGSSGADSLGGTAGEAAASAGG